MRAKLRGGLNYEMRIMKNPPLALRLPRNNLKSQISNPRRPAQTTDRRPLIPDY